MSSPIITLVTGANRGIGEAICQTLVSTIQQPMTLYAASRKGIDLNIKPTTSSTQVKYPKLDITDRSSITNLAALIKNEHGSIDVLINNAGINLDDNYTSQNVATTLDTNYRGTLHMCQTFLPLLSPHGRIVNISSTASDLRAYSPRLQQKFRDPTLTLDELEAMMQEYQHCADTGTEAQNGWPRLSYKVSKSATNTFTAILAREHPDVVINACCPGWVASDMGRLVGSRPPKSPVEGARIPIRLAFEDLGGVSGKYWANPSVSNRGDGQVMER